MMSQRQRWLYWREVKAAQAIVMRGRETWTKHEENEWRHGIHLKALGSDKSSTEFNNRDLDLVLGELRAISRPADLTAQLRQLNQPVFRLRYIIRELARGIARAQAEGYIQGVIDRMDARRGLSDPEETDEWERERERGERPQRKFEDLDEAELLKVKIALTQHERRGEARINQLGRA